MRVLIETEGNIGIEELEKSLATLGVEVVEVGSTTFNEYQTESRKTAKEFADPETAGEFDRQVTAMFLALAINGEAGELAEKVKKYVREEDESYLADAYWELGDILWYWAQFASLVDADADEIAADNLDKLFDRDERGTITGEGDYR